VSQEQATPGELLVGGVSPGRGLARSSILKLLAAGGIARLVILPVTGIANLVIARLITNAVGIEQFGPVMLISTLSQMLIFADLGSAAAVATATARLDGSLGQVEHFRRTFLTALRTMLLCSSVLAAVAIGVAAILDWSVVLGIVDAPTRSGISANLATVAALIAFSVSLPFALGEPLQRGTGHLHRAVLLTGVSAPAALILTLALKAGGAPTFAYSIAIPIGALIGMMCCAGGAVGIVHPMLNGVRAQVLHPRRFPGTAIFATAAPAFVIMIGLPLALQTDRIIISHRSAAASLSDYSYAVQLYLPLWSVVSVAALGLWPIFAGRGARDSGFRRAWVTAVLVLSSIGFAFAVLFLLLSRPIIGWMSGGSATPELPLVVSFAALLIVQSAHVGTGVMLINPRQLRFQAICVIVLVLTNVPLSWILTPRLGPTGPVLASAVTVLACQLIPGILVARRASSPEPHSDSAGDRPPAT
jgi:O-antigen/teichoic acid export membrane protein